MKLVAKIANLLGFTPSAELRELAVKIALQREKLEEFEQELTHQANKLGEYHAKIVRALHKEQQK